METLARRSARLLRHRPDPSLPLPELLELLRGEIPGLAVDAGELAAAIRRGSGGLRVIPAPAEVLPALARWSAGVRERYRPALMAADLGAPPQVVAVEPGPPEEPPAGPRERLVRRMDDTLRALARGVDDGEPVSAARWHRLLGEARRVRRTLGPGDPPGRA